LSRRRGVKNLFRHGVPKMLSEPADLDPRLSPLPLFDHFLTIVPQTFLREDMANPAEVDRMMDQAGRIARAVLDGAEPAIAVMGFSRGGYAAFQLAQRPEVKVVVTMDAATPVPPMPRDFAAAITATRTAFWAFYAEYPDDPGYQNAITSVHRLIDVPEVPFAAVPRQMRCKTLLPLASSGAEKHVEVARQVSASSAVYEWMLRHLG
jgi:pimeloyl-ACP methyl ester carboxylesterase